MKQIVTFITHMGDWQIVIPVTIVIMMYLIYRKKTYIGNILITTTLGSTAIVYALKEAIKAPRPEGINGSLESTYSFPSGHSNIAISFYGVLIYLIWTSSHTRIEKIIFTVPLSILVILIPYSRVYLNVHYPIDVYAGITIGAIWSAGSIAYWNKRKTNSSLLEKLLYQ